MYVIAAGASTLSAFGGGRLAGRDVMERALREAGAGQRWTVEQTNALLALVLQHVGYLHLHGHALAMAQHVFRQACLKVNPTTAARLWSPIFTNEPVFTCALDARHRVHGCPGGLRRVRDE